MIVKFAVALIGLLMPGIAVAARVPQVPTLQSRWVQMALGGVAEARAVVAGKSCPEMIIDKQKLTMRLRAAGDPAFPNLLCAVTLPKTAATAEVLGHDLPVPRARADRIVVFGDTGCRIKGYLVQACNDPAQWPFPRRFSARRIVLNARPQVRRRPRKWLGGNGKAQSQAAAP